MFSGRSDFLRYRIWTILLCRSKLWRRFVHDSNKTSKAFPKSTNVPGPCEEARHLPVKCIPPQASGNHTEIGIGRIRKFIRFTAKSDQDNVKYPSCGLFIVSNWAEDEPEYYGMQNVDSAMGLSKKRHFSRGVPLFVIVCAFCLLQTTHLRTVLFRVKLVWSLAIH